MDALGKNVKLDFCILKSFETCSTEVEIFGPENGGVKKSPFTCTIEVDIQGLSTPERKCIGGPE